MPKVRAQLAPSVVVEDLGDEILVMVGGSTCAVRLAGEEANLVRSLRPDRSAVIDSEHAKALIELGVVVAGGGLPRRGLLRAGAVGFGAGLALIAMPTAASAQSTSELDETGSEEPLPGDYSLIGNYYFSLGDSTLPNGTAWTNEMAEATALSVEVDGQTYTAASGYLSLGVPNWTIPGNSFADPEATIEGSFALGGVTYQAEFVYDD